ncbi:UDP-2,3-diacylglucosamine diphosphatase LpxI [Sneathiella sp. P13V-1]|uniref:LpxI family protein n=1 Tax=Sneathiella sp. P13V-1 TaxID=2697366 RepID=UPI00187B6DF5|nr:UDP-2,3-diacylglucosamine diphosphatase LpxI [Sneathiella sp. P13V-1]MBE7637564.1 UDP-2,3-diacylglucosamine diphosphatase LpxI [Sneathiella sp. P13V-1]
MASASRHNLGLDEKIGIIAGRGDLPLSLASSLEKRGLSFHFLLVEGEADPNRYSGFPHDIVPIAKVGKFLKALKKSGCTAVTLAGPVSRPNFSKLIPDFEGAKLIARIGGALSKGDDGLLSAVTNYIEEKGYHVLGAHELEEELTISSGPLNDIIPSSDQLGDIEKGSVICRQIGALDIGQAIVIRKGYVLAVEAAEGTEKLLNRCEDLSWESQAGVLVKLPKPGQNLKADMPTVGLDTLQQMKSANLSGLVIEAGNTIILDREEFLKKANTLGLFIYAIEASGDV